MAAMPEANVTHASPPSISASSLSRIERVGSSSRS